MEDCVFFLDEQRKPVKSSERHAKKGIYPYYGASGIIDYVDEYLFDDDLILLSEDGANIIDRNYRISFISKGKVWVNNHAHVLKPKPYYSIDFISEFLESLNYSIYNTGTTMPKLNQEVCRGIKVKVPSLTEQSKIGKMLTLMNERIEAQIRIIEELKLLRNTLMFKLFTPKDKWLKLSIGDVAHVIGGGTPDTNIEDYWNGNIQWFTPSEIGKEKYVTGSERTLTQKGLDNSSAKLLPPNTILLSTRATIGECSIAKQECCTNQGFQSLIATSVTPEFLYYLIQTKRRDLLSKASGSTFAEISANEVRRIHICIPATATEQEIIVRPLSAYDEKIETEYKMLHLFKMQKQYLLSHMFI